MASCACRHRLIWSHPVWRAAVLTHCARRASAAQRARLSQVEKREHIDWKRNFTFAFFGLFYLGGVQCALKPLVAVKAHTPPTMSRILFSVADPILGRRSIRTGTAGPSHRAARCAPGARPLPHPPNHHRAPPCSRFHTCACAPQATLHRRLLPNAAICLMPQIPSMSRSSAGSSRERQRSRPHRSAPRSGIQWDAATSSLRYGWDGDGWSRGGWDGGGWDGGGWDGGGWGGCGWDGAGWDGGGCSGCEWVGRACDGWRSGRDQLGRWVGMI